jgi:hypothetical protein
MLDFQFEVIRHVVASSVRRFTFEWFNNISLTLTETNGDNHHQITYHEVIKSRTMKSVQPALASDEPAALNSCQDHPPQNRSR